MSNKCYTTNNNTNLVTFRHGQTLSVRATANASQQHKHTKIESLFDGRSKSLETHWSGYILLWFLWINIGPWTMILLVCPVWNATSTKPNPTKWVSQLQRHFSTKRKKMKKIPSISPSLLHTLATQWWKHPRHTVERTHQRILLRPS